MNNNIKDQIIKLKPNISQSSVNTYNSILKNLYKRVFKDDKYDVEKFEQTGPILSYLKDLEANKRKTTLAALVVITDNKRYRDQMMKDIEEYKANESNQVKNEKQNDSNLNNKINEILELCLMIIDACQIAVDSEQQDNMELLDNILLMLNDINNVVKLIIQYIETTSNLQNNISVNEFLKIIIDLSYTISNIVNNF